MIYIKRALLHILSFIKIEYLLLVFGMGFLWSMFRYGLPSIKALLAHLLFGLMCSIVVSVFDILIGFLDVVVCLANKVIFNIENEVFLKLVRNTEHDD